MGVKLKEAAQAFGYLNGILSVYKPPDITNATILRLIKANVTRDLNCMRVREPETIVEFKRILCPPNLDPNLSRLQDHHSEVTALPSTAPSWTPSKFVKGGPLPREVIGEFQDGPDLIQVLRGQSYADHPLVVGPRYAPEDVKTLTINYLQHPHSGLVLIGLGPKGSTQGMRIFQSRWLRTYRVSARFGLATDTNFITGRTIFKTTFYTIKKYLLDRLLTTLQSSYQRQMFETAGVAPHGEAAYKLAAAGLVRPSSHTDPMLYSIRTISFDLPDFELEVKVINEGGEFLNELVGQIGIKLRNCAVATKVRCVRVGPFDVEGSLLRKHLDLENILTNLKRNEEILKDFDLKERELLLVSQKGEKEGGGIKNVY